MVSEVVLHAGGYHALLLLGLLGAALQRTSPKSYLAVHSCEDLNCGEKKKTGNLEAGRRTGRSGCSTVNT